MNTTNGKIFERRPTEEVLDYMRSNLYQKVLTSPRDLEIVNESDSLFLDINARQKMRVPIRTSFLNKLLLWFNLPNNLVKIVSEDLFLNLINEVLHKIRSKQVVVKLENEQALTITSTLFTELRDLELFEQIKHLDITAISKNDFITRFFTNKKAKQEILPNDYFGFGYNITNSETGFSALAIEHYILRYVCRNGAVAPFSLSERKKYHYNLPLERMKKFIDDQLNYASQSRMNIVNAIKQSSDIDAVKSRYQIMQKLNYLLENRGGNDFMNGFDWNQSKYDVFNYITHNAKSFDVNKRYRLEGFAGEIILN